MDFNYMLVIGNSGTGKTTHAKTVVSQLKEAGVKVYAFDPNRQWYDLHEDEVGVEELSNALTKIAKPLLFEKRDGVLIIEDIGFSLQRIKEVMGCSLNRAKNMVKIILENARKYGLKVIVIAHRLQSDEIDQITFQQFDAKVVFNTPLTNYGKKLLTNAGFDHEEVTSLPRFHYIAERYGEFQSGEVQPLESHIKIEKDRDFQMRELLSNCKSLSQKILALKMHLDMSNGRIADVLDTSELYVKVTLSRWRKRFLRDRGDKIIPDGRTVDADNILV